MDLFYWLSTLNDNENLLYFVSFQMHERNFEEVLLGLDEWKEVGMFWIPKFSNFVKSKIGISFEVLVELYDEVKLTLYSKYIWYNI